MVGPILVFLLTYRQLWSTLGFEPGSPDYSTSLTVTPLTHISQNPTLFFLFPQNSMLIHRLLIGLRSIGLSFWHNSVYFLLSCLRLCTCCWEAIIMSTPTKVSHSYFLFPVYTFLTSRKFVGIWRNWILPNYLQSSICENKSFVL